MMKRATLIYLSAVLLIMSSCQKEYTDFETSIIKKSKQSLEEMGSTISLPIYPLIDTRANNSQSVVLLWDHSLITESDQGQIIEVPLGGTAKLKAAFITSKNGEMVYSKATTKSYLVMEYNDGCVEPEVYVETFIQKGRFCKMHKGYDFTKARGFELQTDLSGGIIRQTAFIGGRIISFGKDEMESSKECVESVTAHIMQHRDLVGYRLVPCVLKQTRSVCPIYEYFVCPKCYMIYQADIKDPDFACPYCGYRYYDKFLTFCPICGEEWDKCICQDTEESCPPCGRNSDNCSCDCQYRPGDNIHGTCTCE